MANMATTSAWPNGAPAAVSLTFDVDAESTRLNGSPGDTSRLSYLSEGRFGITRGIPRILDLLAEYSLPATFYVPGTTAETYPDAVRQIVDVGHEIGHHGHAHLHPASINASGQREELVRGMAALAACGVTPTGYRAPSWELTPETLTLLIEHGFRYDSSCMGDDRPYYECYGSLRILELPVHWTLDDWVYFGWEPYGPPAGGALMEPRGVLETWKLELASAIRDSRHVTYTMHPEVMGRGYPFEMLREFVEYALTQGVWFCGHGEVVDALRMSEGELDESTA